MSGEKTWVVLAGCALAAGALLADEVEMPKMSEASAHQIGIVCTFASVAIAIVGGMLVRWLARKRKRDDVAAFHHPSSAC